jgi:hypothetical protein
MGPEGGSFWIAPEEGSNVIRIDLEEAERVAATPTPGLASRSNRLPEGSLRRGVS